MPSMLISVDGPAAPAEVWRRYTSPAAWPGWAPQITRVDSPDDPIVTITKGVVHGPLLIRVPFRILHVDPDTRRWSWQVGIGPLGLRMEHGVDEVPDGSRAWVRIHAPTVLVLPYVPVARFALRRVVA
ncbi:MAG: SRPBCC family protein [Nocardioides sp.]